MSRRALWPTGEDRGAANGAAQAALATPTIAPSASLPGRSALAAQVKLARLATLLGEAAGILQELSEVPLAVPTERALMSSMGDQEKPARLMSVRDVALRLSLSERTVRRLRRQGVLPAGIEIAGVIRWTAESIDRWIGDQR